MESRRYLDPEERIKEAEVNGLLDAEYVWKYQQALWLCENEFMEFVLAVKEMQARQRAYFAGARKGTWSAEERNNARIYSQEQEKLVADKIASLFPRQPVQKPMF